MMGLEVVVVGRLDGGYGAGVGGLGLTVSAGGVDGQIGQHSPGGMTGLTGQSSGGQMTSAHSSYRVPAPL